MDKGDGFHDARAKVQWDPRQLPIARWMRLEDAHAQTDYDIQSDFGLPATGANLSDQESCHAKGYSRQRNPRQGPTDELPWVNAPVQVSCRTAS